MSNEKINLSEDNGFFNNQKENNFLLMNKLIMNSDFVDKSLNFFIENFPKEEKNNSRSNKLLSSFGGYNILFYDKICSIKEKINTWKLTNENIINQKNSLEIKDEEKDKEMKVIYGSSGINEIIENY